MLKNTFRKLVGILLVLIFGVAIVKFLQQTAGSQYLGGALSFGLKVLLVLALLLWGAFLYDKRVNRRQP